jgi:hypothetical protein
MSRLRGGGKIWYLVYGERNGGTPLLVLHGGPGFFSMPFQVKRFIHYARCNQALFFVCQEGVIDLMLFVCGGARVRAADSDRQVNNL